MFSKPKNYYTVIFNVELSELELAIIRERGLGKEVLLSWEEPDNTIVPVIHVTLDALIRNKGFGQRFYTPAEAKQFDVEARDALKNIKLILEANASIGQSDSFEL